MRKTIVPAIIGLLVIMIVTIGGWLYYNKVINNIELEEINETNSYTYHYVLVVDNTESVFWNSIYESAKEEAARNDAYLEFVGSTPASDYTVADYLEISIAARVDGIIVEPNGDYKVEKLIEKASKNGIPVVTVMEDTKKSQSSRISFVGINSYELGQIYGEAVCKFVTDDTKKVLVLLKDGTENYGIYAYMKAAVNERLSGQMQIEIQSYQVDSKISFETEEIIRDIFLDTDMVPDILVCLDETDTECAYWAAIDYNKVGVVDIIGYYPSETIISAIEKGIVLAAFQFDKEKIGRDCINALVEFKQMGYVSDYYSVDVEMVTKENINEFRESVP